MEDVESTYITMAHGPLARPRKLQERIGNVGKHTGYFVRYSNNLEYFKIKIY